MSTRAVTERLHTFTSLPSFNIFVYQISLIFLLICVPCPRSYCSLYHVNLYVLLLLLLDRPTPLRRFCTTPVPNHGLSRRRDGSHHHEWDMLWARSPIRERHIRWQIWHSELNTNALAYLLTYLIQ